MNCYKCGENVDGTGGFPCDSCKRWMCNNCSDLSASEVRCLQLKKRVLKFCCSDCESGLLQVPLLLRQMEENTRKLEALTEKFNNISALTSGTSFNSPTPEEVVVEAMERIKRSHNLIFKSIPESGGGVPERINHDEQYVCNVLSSILEDEPILRPQKVIRIGRRSANRPRPLKAVFSNSATCKRVLRSKNRLAGTQFRNVSIQDDRTPAQLAHLQELRNELKRRMDAGEVNITIKYVRGIPTIVSNEPKNQTREDTLTGVSATRT